MARGKTLAGLLHRVAVHVGGENLERGCSAAQEFLERLSEHDGQRVGLFARRATGRPRPQRVAGWPGGEQLGQDFVAQLVPGRGVAKEAGHPDEQLLEEEVQFLGILAQIAHILARRVKLVQSHSPIEAAKEVACL